MLAAPMPTGTRVLTPRFARNFRIRYYDIGPIDADDPRKFTKRSFNEKGGSKDSRHSFDSVASLRAKILRVSLRPYGLLKYS